MFLQATEIVVVKHITDLSIPELKKSGNELKNIVRLQISSKYARTLYEKCLSCRCEVEETG